MAQIKKLIEVALPLDAINAVREGKELEHNIYSNAISVDASNVDDYLQ